MAKLQFNPEKVSANNSGDNLNKSNEEDFRKSYKLDNGPNDFRCVVHDDGSIIEDQWIHTHLGEWFFCPEKLHPDDPKYKCPSCAFGWKMYNKNKELMPGEENRKQWHTQESRKWLAQYKGAIRGIFRAKEEEDCKKNGFPMLRFFDLSATNAKAFRAFFNLTDKNEIRKWGKDPICDIEKGRDITLIKDKQKALDGQNSVSMERSPAVSKLFLEVEQTEELIDKMVEAAPKLSERYAIKSIAEIEEMISEYNLKLRKELSEKPDFNDGESESFKNAVEEVSEGKSDIDKILDDDSDVGF